METLQLAGDRAVWERQPDETPAQHAAFEQYLQLGPARGVRELAEQSGRGITQLRTWYNRGQWGRRAREWDREQRYQTDLEAYTAQHEAASTVRQAAARAAELAGHRLHTAEPDEIAEIDMMQASRITSEAARALNTVAPPAPLPPAARTPLGEALAAQGPSALPAAATAQHVELTAAAAEQASRGDSRAAAQAASGLAAVAAVDEDHQPDPHIVMTTLDTVLRHYPEAYTAVLAALEQHMQHEDPG